MANNNVVVIYDKLQSAVKKLEQYYAMLEEQQKMIARLDTYFDHLYKVHGKKNTFTSTMEDDIQSMAAAIKTDMADMDYLKNLTSYIIQSYTDAEGNTTTRSHALLMSALGSIVPTGAGAASATIYSNMNEYSTAINQDSSRAADTSQYGDKKWVTYAETNATTADAWDAVHENSSINKESHAYKISATGTKISSKAQNVVVKDMEKDVTEAQEKVKQAEEELAAKEKEMQAANEKATQAEAKAQEAEERAQKAEAKVVESETKEAQTTSKETQSTQKEAKQESSSSSGGSTQSKQETSKPETNNNESTTGQKTETQQGANNNSTPIEEDPSNENNNSLVDNPTTTNPEENQGGEIGTGDTDPGVIIDPVDQDSGDGELPDPTPKKSSSGSSKVIPIIAGLSAAGAAGVGAKIILDKKSDKDINEDDEWKDNNDGFIGDQFIEGNQSEEDQYLDSSDEFTYKTDIEPHENDLLEEDNFEDVTEEEEVQGYQAIDFNDITETH